MPGLRNCRWTEAFAHHFFRRDAAGEGEFSEERVRQAYQQMGLEFPTLAELVQAAMDMPTALQAVLQSAFALTKDFAPTF